MRFKNTADNICTNGIVTVMTRGDVNADGVVDVLDVAGVGWIEILSQLAKKRECVKDIAHHVNA